VCDPHCRRDVDGNGQIDAFDLANLLGCWGPFAPGSVCECFDKDGDGQIRAIDLASLLGNWGPCLCTEDADCPEGQVCQDAQCVQDQKVVNDQCDTATAITDVPFSDLGIRFADAEDDPNIDPSCDNVLDCEGTAANSGLWYVYTPSMDCTALIDRVGPNDTVVSVWSGMNCNSLTELICLDSESASVMLTGGTTYFIVVSNFLCMEEPQGPLDFFFDCVQQECGNDIREGSESCDGLDAGDCQFGCGEDCTCTPQPPPANDHCPESITIFTDVPAFGQTDTATGEDVSLCTLNDAPDAWHCWTADCDGWATFSLCGDGTDFDTTMAIYDDCGGNELACNDDNDDCQESRSQVTLPVSRGTEYVVRASGFNGSHGEYELLVTCTSAQCGNGVTEGGEQCDGPTDAACPGGCQEDCTCGPPTNDGCDDAIDVGGLPAVAAGDSTFATDEDPDVCGTLIGSAGVWFTVVGNGNILTASTCDSVPFDSRLHVFCGTCAGPFCAGADDDGCGEEGGGSTVSWCSDAGTTYYVLVTGVDAEDRGAFELVVQEGLPCTDPPACEIPEVPTGACCTDVEAGECIDDLYEEACHGRGGAYGGDASMCSSVECATLTRCIYELVAVDPCEQELCEGKGVCPIAGVTFYDIDCEDASSCAPTLQRSVRCEGALPECCCTGTFELISPPEDRCRAAPRGVPKVPKEFCPQREKFECEFSRTQNTPFVIPPKAAKKKAPAEDERADFQEFKPNGMWEKCLWFESNQATIKIEADPTNCGCDPDCVGQIQVKITLTLVGITGGAGQGFSIMCDSLGVGEFTKQDAKRCKVKMGKITSADALTAQAFVPVPDTDPFEVQAMLNKKIPCLDGEYSRRLSILPTKVVDNLNMNPGSMVMPGDGGSDPNLGRPAFIDFTIKVKDCGEEITLEKLFFLNFATLKDERCWFKSLKKHANVADVFKSVKPVETDLQNPGGGEKPIPACHTPTVFRKLTGGAENYPDKGPPHVDPASVCGALLKFVESVRSFKANASALGLPVDLDALCDLQAAATAAVINAAALKGFVLASPDSTQGQKDNACAALAKAQKFRTAVNDAKSKAGADPPNDLKEKDLKKVKDAACELDAAAYSLLVGDDAIYPWSKFIMDLKACLRGGD